jgi:hypothetical protein
MALIVLLTAIVQALKSIVDLVKSIKNKKQEVL